MKDKNPNATGPFSGGRPPWVGELILGSLSELICALGPDLTIFFVNRPMQEFAGMKGPVEGRGLGELGLERGLFDQIRLKVDEALLTGLATDCVVQHHDGKGETAPILFTWTPVLAQDTGQKMVVGMGRALQDAQFTLELQQANERQRFLLGLADVLRPLSDTGEIQHEATRLLGEQLDVDRTYYAGCDESLQLAVIERDYVRTDAPSLVGIHHYADFEAIVSPIRSGKPFVANDVLLMPEVQPQVDTYIANQMRALIAMPLMKDGQMVACLAVTSSRPRHWSKSEVLLLQEVAERTWEAVERARWETALKKSEQLMTTIFESLPVGVGLVENDGRVSLGNRELRRYLPENIIPSADERITARWKAWDARGNPLSRDHFPGVRALRGESVLPGIEMLYTGDDGNATWTQVAAVPLGGQPAEHRGLLTVITNIDQIKRTKSNLEDIEQQFRRFVAASSDLVYRMSSDWRLMYTLSGSGLLKETAEPIADWLHWYIPTDEHSLVRESIARARAEKSMFELEHRVNLASGAIGWVISRAIPLLDEYGEIREWVGAANDITARKAAQQDLQDFAQQLELEVGAQTRELKDSRDQLQSILDTSLMQMSILRAVRDENGQIQDIEITLANKKHEQVMGRTDLIGVHYVKEYPGMKQSVLFGLIVKTIETGEPQETEYYYPYEGFNSWYASMFVKLNDGVVAFTMDISARKNAEQERFRNYLLLQQSEQIAAMGSWDFDITTGTFSWSDGMYKLFDIKARREIAPEIYLRYATDKGYAAAERLVSHIRSGESDFAETLELNVNGRTKILKVKATVVRDENRKPVRVLGIDMDHTASIQAEQKIRQMESQQQELIFRATLATQEEERRRISESLHNGLAQTLFGIKINLSHLSIDQAVNRPDQYGIDKKYAEGLLVGAIAESRRISHELVPSILEDFGLAAAIADVCKQLGNEIKFTCRVIGFEQRLDKYIELAAFRIVQELMLNAAKHSGASSASAHVQVNQGIVQIRVKDNGRGMAATASDSHGIGLASIRSKMKLLNGMVKIESPETGGTMITVHLPLPSQ